MWLSIPAQKKPYIHAQEYTYIFFFFSLSNSVGGTGGVQNPSGDWTFIPEA